jgi:hypothetical protein
MTDEKLRRILEDKKLRMMLEEASPQQEIERLRDEIARLRLTDAERRGMDTDNTQGVNEPSPASAGSHAAVAWAVTPTGKDGEIDCEFVYPCEATAGDVALGCNGVVVPLYRYPTLTDEEWEAVWLAIGMFAEGPEHIKRHEEMADALRGLLERLGGAK